MHAMKMPLRLALACLCLLAAAAAQAGDGTADRDMAQASRCGPRPMKPSSCLNGAWVCRCHASGQICDWELVGCGTGDRLKPGSSDRRPKTTTPNDPARPGTYNR
jgi:hypothetical protein